MVRVFVGYSFYCPMQLIQEKLSLPQNPFSLPNSLDHHGYKIIVTLLKREQEMEIPHTQEPESPCTTSNHFPAKLDLIERRRSEAWSL